MKPLLEIEFGQCKWPVSDEMPSQIALSKDMPFAPHLFCGEPVANSDVKCVYCASHLARAYGGQGKDWHSIEVMLKTVERNVSYVGGAASEEAVAVDEALVAKQGPSVPRTKIVSGVRRNRGELTR